MGQVRHLISRFFEVLGARGLSPREQAEAEGMLRERERELFWGQPVADQRHGLESAKRVLVAAPGRRDLARAALLHDVGKQVSRLTVPGRSVASVMGLLGLPIPARFRAYLDHGRIGAEALTAVGAEDLIVAFTAAHHAGRPAGIHEDDWALLRAADEKAVRGG